MKDSLQRKIFPIKVKNSLLLDDVDASLKLSERGIQTFFYVAIRNHVSLGDLADKKANLLLTLSALIFSLLIAKLFFKITALKNEYFVIPFIILMISSVATVVLAVLVTRPKVTAGKFDKQDLKENKVNLAFFGNFHAMSYEEFNWAIVDMLKQKDDIYSTLTKDLYYLGLVLNKKYRILSIAYLVFITGFALAIVTAIFVAKT